MIAVTLAPGFAAILISIVSVLPWRMAEDVEPGGEGCGLAFLPMSDLLDV